MTFTKALQDCYTQILDFAALGKEDARQQVLATKTPAERRALLDWNVERECTPEEFLDNVLEELIAIRDPEAKARWMRRRQEAATR